MSVDPNPEQALRREMSRRPLIAGLLVILGWIKTPLGTAICLVLVAAYFAPLFLVHPSQDACSFGPVSNQRYRELLADAKFKQARQWPSLVWENDRRNRDLLNARFDDVSRGMTSVYEKLAAMHAVVRALGGDYRRTQVDRDDPYENTNRLGIVSFDYHVDVNRLYFFSPLRRQMRVIGIVVIVDNVSSTVIQDRRRSKRGDIEFIAWVPTFYERYIIIPRSKFGESCPRLPSKELAERLSQ